MKNKFILTIFILLGLVGCTVNSNSNTSNKESNINESSKIISDSLIESNVSSSDIYDDTDVADVIILAGQSNMEGHSWTKKLLENTPSSMHEYYNNGFEDTQIIYHCNKGANRNMEFESVKIGQGFNNSCFGPEIGIAEELMARNYDRPVYLIKYSLGATSLYNPDHWNADSPNGLYSKMVSYIYQQISVFEAQGMDVQIKGLFWMQGEADSCDAGGLGGTRYYDDLSNFVSSFRDEFEFAYGDEDKGIAFVDAGISNYTGWKNYKVVNEAKKEFAESDPDKNYYFSTIDEGLEFTKDNTDYAHFDATSELELGKLFISKLLENGWL